MNELNHLIRVVTGMEPPRTQVTEEELRLLRAHAAQARVVVEIGCFEGRTAAALAASTEGEVYSIDLFPRGRLGVSCSEWIARWGKLRSGARNLTIVRGSSRAVAGAFDLPIDLLFIDGDHSYEGVRRDFDDWVPEVRPGGVVALHDCRQTPRHPRYHGSNRFYDEDLKEMDGLEELQGVESLAVFRKQPAPKPLTVPALGRLELHVNAGPGGTNGIGPTPGKAA